LSDITEEEFEAMQLEDGQERGLAPTGDRLEKLVNLGSQLSDALSKQRQLKAEEKANNERIKSLAEKQIPDMMAELQITTQGLPPPFGTLIIEDIVAAKMPSKSDEPDRYNNCVAWLDEHNLGDIVKREVVATFGKDSAEQVARMMEAMRKATNGEIPVTEKYDVHYQTLNAALKAEKKAGRQLPKGTDGFEIFIGPRAKLIK
jgi:hypothetical protein